MTTTCNQFHNEPLFPEVKRTFSEDKTAKYFFRVIIAIKTSQVSCVGKPKASGGGGGGGGGVMHLTASGLRPSGVRCIRPP